jgi:hypothetical protein
MAIKRCPYCRALIDEKEQYCNNCGTQLLFPEDGAVEEEIPGDKIIDADVEEKDYEIPEPGADKPVDDPEEEDEEAEVDEDEEDEEEQELDAGGEPEDDEEDEEEEEPEKVVLVEDEEREPSGSPESAKPGTSEIPAMFSAPGRDEPADGEEAEGEDKEEPPPPPDAGPIPEKPVREPEPGPSGAGEPAEPPPSGKKPLTFDTSDLDKIGRTAELGKEQVENFLDVLKEREKANRLDRVASREPEENLPPWAAEIKDGGVEPSPEVKVKMMREDDIEAQEPEESDTPEEALTPPGLEEREPPRARKPRVADSGIGLPERVTQAALPFEREIPRDERPARPSTPPAAARRPIVRDEEISEEAEEEAETREARPRQPFRLTVFLKAKAFDVLFVAVFWLASLWIAARTLGVTLFQMLGTASSGLLAYFGALLVLYFFLFYFFLGETLGDRLFRDTD